MSSQESNADGAMYEVPGSRLRELTDDIGRLRERVADLEGALSWALAYIADAPPQRGEQRENYTGAQRVAWPDEPENWDGE